MSKTTLWRVSLTFWKRYMQGNRYRPVIVVTRASDKAPLGAVHSLSIRTISPKAAARKYIRDNLPTTLHLLDDGANEPGDLLAPNPHNQYKPRQEMRWAKRGVKSNGGPVIIVRK